MIEINYLILNSHHNRFVDFISKQNGGKFTSFSHPFIDVHENYKFRVRDEALTLLQYWTWKKEDVGNGKIIDKTISAIELTDNNLVNWQARYGDEQRDHHSLYKAKSEKRSLKEYEILLYNFFNSKEQDEICFESFIKTAGKKYSYIAFLFFLKDNRKYLPIAPSIFDNIFKMLGVDFQTSRKCSWENYQQYNQIISEVRNFLSTKIPSQVNLLDAHSFLWILGNQMRVDISETSKAIYRIPIITEYKPKRISSKEIVVTVEKEIISTSIEVDFLKRHEEQIQIGKLAEDIVLEKERDILKELGRVDLAEEVKKVSDNFSLGYDILSFEVDGEEKQIEVKAAKTIGEIKTFFLTNNEFNKSTFLSNYYLYLVVNINSITPEILCISNPNFSDKSKFSIEPFIYKVSFE